MFAMVQPQNICLCIV